MKKKLNIFWAFVFTIVIIYNGIMIFQQLPIGDYRWVQGEVYAGEREYRGSRWVYDVKADYTIDGKAYTTVLGVNESRTQRGKVTLRYNINDHHKVKDSGIRYIVINAVVGIGALGYLFSTIGKIRKQEKMDSNNQAGKLT